MKLLLVLLPIFFILAISINGEEEKQDVKVEKQDVKVQGKQQSFEDWYHGVLQEERQDLADLYKMNQQFDEEILSRRHFEDPIGLRRRYSRSGKKDAAIGLRRRYSRSGKKDAAIGTRRRSALK